jgi:hypothetical protein
LINNKKLLIVKRLINRFREFEQINENDKLEKIPLRGYSFDTIISRIEELMSVMPDRVKFGVPADNKGYALTYRDANGAIQKIQDLNHYYSGKGEDVKFYCWNISYSGSWDATKSLQNKIEEFGGFGREVNLNLKRIIEYFSDNPEDADNVRSLSISIDSKSVREDAMSNREKAEYPQPTGEESPTSELDTDTKKEE